MKTSSTQKEYKKQLNRIKNAIKRGEKQGYLFPENILDEFTVKRPSKRTVERLKKVKPAQLYAKKGAIFLDVETGEITPATQKRKQVRKEAYKKAQKTRQNRKSLDDLYKTQNKNKIKNFDKSVSDAFIDELRNNIENSGAKILYQWALDRRNTIGVKSFEKEIRENFKDGLYLNFDVLNDEEKATKYIYDFISKADKNFMSYEEFLSIVNSKQSETTQTEEPEKDDIPSFYDTICDNFIDEIRSNLHMAGAKLLYTWAINRRNTIGEEAFGKEIMENNERGLILTFEVLYDDRVATQFINDFVSRAYNNDMITEEEFLDFVEANEEDEAIFTED